jgi:Zn-finger nucleic acid-binding protein
MERMLCESCAAVSYSAAARQIVERGQPCPRCGGVLTVDARERVTATAPADAAAARDLTERSER